MKEYPFENRHWARCLIEDGVELVHAHSLTREFSHISARAYRGFLLERSIRYWNNHCDDAPPLTRTAWQTIHERSSISRARGWSIRYIHIERRPRCKQEKIDPVLWLLEITDCWKNYPYQEAVKLIKAFGYLCPSCKRHQFKLHHEAESYWHENEHVDGAIYFMEKMCDIGRWFVGSGRRNWFTEGLPMCKSCVKAVRYVYNSARMREVDYCERADKFLFELLIYSTKKNNFFLRRAA